MFIDISAILILVLFALPRLLLALSLSSTEDLYFWIYRDKPTFDGFSENLHDANESRSSRSLTMLRRFLAIVLVGLGNYESNMGIDNWISLTGLLATIFMFLLFQIPT